MLNTKVYYGAILLVLILGVTSGAGRKSDASSPESEVSKGSNKIRLKDPQCVPGDCICYGSPIPELRLNETGPRLEELQEGVRCIAADFDGNGFADFALPGSEGIVNVSMNNDGGFFRAERIDAGGVLELYSPRDSVGEHGEPVSKYHGLMVRWVGQNHAVFIWNNGGFNRILFPGYYEKK